MPEVNSTKSLDKHVGNENVSGPLNYESDENEPYNIIKTKT